MPYLFSRAFQKLWINRKPYFFIILELGIGFAVVLCGICSEYSARSKIALCKQQIGNDGVAIEYYNVDTYYSSTVLPITVEDYITLQETYKESDLSYLIFSKSIYLKQETYVVRDVTFISVDKNTFFRLFGYVPKDDTIYLGSMLSKDSENEILTFFEEWFSWDDSGIKIGNYYIKNVEELAVQTEAIMVDTSWDLGIQSSIILPEKYMMVLQENADHPCSRLRIMPNANISVSDISYGILRALENSHPDYSYRISDKYAELKKSITDLTEGIRFFSWIARLVLIISTVGIIGILLIYMEKRKRELAIALALGGTHLMIFAEIFIEIFSLCFMGGILGVIVTIIAIPKLSTSVFTAHFQWNCIVVMLGTVLMISIISCTCIIWEIRRVHPMKILKN